MKHTTPPRGKGQAAAAPGMSVEMRPTQDVRPYEKNAKRHAKSQVRKVADSIREFGWAQPLAVDASGTLIVGHCRLEAAKLLGLKEVPVVVMDGLTAAQVRALRLADNRLNESAWDMGLVIEELKGLTVEGIDLTGFSRDLVIEPGAGDDDAPAPPKKAVTRLGQLYQLGDHRLLCGDSTRAEDVARLMRDGDADLFVTDPPYGVSYGEKNASLNKVDGGKRISVKIANDSGGSKVVGEILGKAFHEAYEHSKVGACIYCFAPQGGDQMMMMMMMIETRWNPTMHQLIWKKNNHVMGRTDYSYIHEPIIYSWKGTGHKFHGGFQTSVLEFSRPNKSDLHPTMKPVELLEKLICNSSMLGETVLDLFGGSGSTLIACEKAGRKCRMMEIDPSYCDVIVTRWERMTGRKAKLLK